MKVRIGKAFDKKNNKDLYQLQFKLDGERTYKGLSYDTFESESDAKDALNKHLNGERKYSYCVSVNDVVTTIKGNCVRNEERIMCHIMSAKSDLPTSQIWIKVNND